MTTFERVAEAAGRYGRAVGEYERRMTADPHPYVRDPHSGAGNCATCHHGDEREPWHRVEGER